jgi:hypothetical protein
MERIAALGQKRSPIPFKEWPSGAHPASGLLTLLVENDCATETNGAVFVSHPTIACMSPAETSSLGMPRRCPYALRLEAVGAVSDPKFRIRVLWLDDKGGEVCGLRRQGILLTSVVERFLVCEPLYSLLEEVDGVNAAATNEGATTGLDARMVRFARFKDSLASATGDASADAYLDRLTIRHATALSVAPAAGAPDTFEPRLFGDVPQPHASPDNEEVTAIRRPLLSLSEAAHFAGTLFPRQGARSHYRLGEGVYSVVEPAVEAALRVIERVNGSDPATKAAFRADPRSFLIGEMEQAGGGGDVLIDPDDELGAPYGARVLGIREWEGVRLSFKIPVHREWFPLGGEETESFTIQPDGGPPLVVTPAKVADLRDTMDEAAQKGADNFQFEGKQYRLTTDFVDTVDRLLGLVAPDRPPAPPPTAPKPIRGGKRLVLRVVPNEEDLAYTARLRGEGGRLGLLNGGNQLRTPPLPHQADGIAWLTHAYLSGMPGVLLADDMGLGKTFQVLSFLNWLKVGGRLSGQPILVVAPKKLLEVWLDEIALHIGAEGLGRPELAYDDHLKGLKVSAGKEGELGRHVLDVGRLTAADWVLTTYETLRDYQMSFGQVPFSVAIYDEAQKLKNMASLVNNAAMAQQPDFTILMTGTPIENSVMDLWTLLDVAWPGFLGLSGREFAKTYGDGATPDVFAELKRQLIEPASVGDRACPPVMLRRFKADVVTGLPTKREHKWRESMPPEQVRVYDAAIADQKARRVPALQALQALRSAAFHPDLRMPDNVADHARIIGASARFKSLFAILDEAKRLDERVLVFVDLRQGQRVLAELIRHRYRLPRHPQVINGDTATRALAQIKADFQSGRGFEVLLLGPRSAGFGLTLTAANHVVHLNRWWNPAVEDQCSDRVYRLGQSRPVTIHVPIAVHPLLGDASFDAVLDMLLSEKRALSREIVVPTTMTEGDFKRMMAALVGDEASVSDPSPELDTMGWKAFEQWTAEQFVKAGFQASMTPRTGDAGADIVLRPPPGSKGRPVICQCKHRSMGKGTMDEGAVEAVLTAAAAYSARNSWLHDPVLMAVTNGAATVRASNLAAQNGVVLVDKESIRNLAAMAKAMLAH